MDKVSSDSSDKEGSERRNSNSEWLPTKCRITKPPPPKPATNPLQFVKVSPSNLFQKAHEQIKKVEEIKTKKPGIKEDAEEWQQNLDNWKSSRRKRQEHIIERVVEVKKFEQEGFDKTRRKSKTFSEMLEERNKRGHRLNIPIYDDDSNDLSDYGIGSSSSKANSVKDVDTDDSSSCLDDKVPGISTSDSQSGKDASSASNQSQSEDELLNTTNHSTDKDNNSKPFNNIKYDEYLSTISKNISNVRTKFEITVKEEEYVPENYTFQKAIEDYRSKILPKLNEPEAIYTVNFDRTSTPPITKVEMYTPPAVYDSKKPTDIIDLNLDLNNSKRLPEDFVNSPSIKERLQNLKVCVDTQVKKVEKNTQGASVKSIIQSLTKQTDNDNKNNNFEPLKFNEPADNLTKVGNITDSVTLYLVNQSSEENMNNKSFDRSESPEGNAYNKMYEVSYDLNSYFLKSYNPMGSLTEYCGNTTAPPSVSSSELIGLSSDREDSGIHTAEASCAVSQADESVEYNEMLSSTIPNCIEKLQKERERELTNQVESKLSSQLRDTAEATGTVMNLEDYATNYKVLIQSTQKILDNIREHANNDYSSKLKVNDIFTNSEENTLPAEGFVQEQKLPVSSDYVIHSTLEHEHKSSPVIDDNLDIKNYSAFIDDSFVVAAFPLAPPKTKEPPKEKPPPPPPASSEEDEKFKQPNLKRLSSTKRIKKEIYIKRSSFLGLDEPTDDVIDPVIPIDTPPDVNTFLQKESQLEKSLYRKYQDSREPYSSEVESQDSGLESERGRLSSDTWCSSISTHGRQDSEQTNHSITSEEDEIAKKEREIIALIEEEEKSKDPVQHSNTNSVGLACCNVVHNHTTDKLKIPYIPKNKSNYSSYVTDKDSEVLRVEHELMQLEHEDQLRKKESRMFGANKEKLFTKNRHSLENICDVSNTFSGYYENINCIKSMPELPNNQQVANFYKYQNMKSSSSHFKTVRGNDTYRKSMPDIQQAYLRSVDINEVRNDLQLPLEHRKSMPELQNAVSFQQLSSNRQPVMPGKPLTSLIKEQRDRDKLLMTTAYETNPVQYQNIKPGIPITRPGLNALSAVPKHRHIPNDNWIQPKINADNRLKSYSKHWLYQEAELRRLSEQKTNIPKWNYQPLKQEKHIPEPIIQSLTQRFQNSSLTERSHHKRSDNNFNQDAASHPYMNRQHMVGHALPIAYPPVAVENIEGKILSVSGKKKCSFCGTELGRGAAMIIESLCLFYHMDCFKCCVCHVQLGDGQMGTDVRVRNQKLHCHNCYTSDDGVKFSCV